MNTKPDVSASTPLLTKPDPSVPALVVTGAGSIAIRAGTSFAGRAFAADTLVGMPDLLPDRDYVVVVGDVPDARVAESVAGTVGADVLGGFHFAAGGCAAARSGGDETPAINPHSLWDLAFRPACPDPRGMALVEGRGGRFWADIYLLGVDHVDQGTSRFGATIADGEDLPAKAGGGTHDRLDYATAAAIMREHGKGLLSVEEFFAAAYGVAEKTATGKDPRVTGLDAPRTSRWGLMQATGNMWVWGHDGDPDEPRASIFGGVWWGDGYAGSRQANVAYCWPGASGGGLGARGRCDHLQPV